MNETTKELLDCLGFESLGKDADLRGFQQFVLKDFPDICVSIPDHDTDVCLASAIFHAGAAAARAEIRRHHTAFVNALR